MRTGTNKDTVITAVVVIPVRDALPARHITHTKLNLLLSVKNFREGNVKCKDISFGSAIAFLQVTTRNVAVTSPGVEGDAYEHVLLEADVLHAHGSLQGHLGHAAVLKEHHALRQTGSENLEVGRGLREPQLEPGPWAGCADVAVMPSLWNGIELLQLPRRRSLPPTILLRLREGAHRRER